MTRDQVAEVWKRCDETVNEGIKRARKVPNPDPVSVFDHVWSASDGDHGRDILAESLGMQYGGSGVANAE